MPHRKGKIATSYLMSQISTTHLKSWSLINHSRNSSTITKINENWNNFAEKNNEKLCQFYTYKRVTESFIGKEGKPI